MLRTTMGGWNLQTCIYNASGPLCTTRKELKKIDKYSRSAIVLSKSCTLMERDGNEFPRYYQNEWCSINSTGLANLGYAEYMQYKFNKPYFISIAGLSIEDNIKIFEDLDYYDHWIDGVELNMSCPNIIGKSQIGYDFESSSELLRRIFECNSMCKTFGIKLPPYFDNTHFHQMADVISEFKGINYITCINSLGNGLVIDYETESTVIRPNGGMGGIGGSVIKPIALSNVRKFYELIGDRVDIIGCGGIVNGEDAFEHILCGAKMVQIGTQFMREGVECFERIENELIEIMERKGYSTLDEFRGKLQYI